MKKSFLSLIVLFAASQVFAADAPVSDISTQGQSTSDRIQSALTQVEPTAINGTSTPDNGSPVQVADDKSADEAQAVYISEHLKVAPTSVNETDAKLGCKIDASYPQIAGDDLAADVHAQQFNKLIDRIAKEEITKFKNNVLADKIHLDSLPEGMRNNSLHMDYDIDIVKPSKNAIVSVRMSVESMQAGRPHPYHAYRVVNFDLATGKQLTLNELFKTNPKFLAVISKYCRESLNKKLNDKWMISQGTEANVKNFKNWNLQTDSLLITFDEYQVAPYSNGPQEVEIPYSALKKVMAAKAPVYSCLAHPEICSGEKVDV